MHINQIFIIIISISALKLNKKLANASSLEIDAKGLLGCYADNGEEKEFNILMSHINSSDLTPESCKQACEAMNQNYKLAGLKIGSMCLCRDDYSVDSQIESTENCKNIACSGNSTFSCGSLDSSLVYEIDYSKYVGSQINYRIKNSSTNLDMVLINKFAQFNIEYEEKTMKTTGNYNLKHTFTETGRSTIILYPTKDSQGDQTVERSAFQSPFIYEPVSNVEIKCPLMVEEYYNIYCDVIYSTGSHVKVILDYGDETNETLEILYGNTISYGVPYVPQISFNETVTYSEHSVFKHETYDSNVPDKVTTNDFLLPNTLINEMGLLSSIEIYGHEAGDIILKIMRIDTCNGSATLRNPQFFSECIDSSEYNLFTCNYNQSDEFSKEKETCNFSKHLKIFDSFSIANEKTFKEIPLTISKGYNMFCDTDFNEINVQPGDIFILEQNSNGKVAVDRSSDNINTFSDYWIESSMLKEGIFNGVIINFQFRLTISPIKRMSTFKKYATNGTYTINVKLENLYSNGQLYTVDNTTEIEVGDMNYNITITQESRSSTLNYNNFTIVILFLVSYFSFKIQRYFD